MAIGDTCTPIYGLPFATADSRPCDIDIPTCAALRIVDQKLNEWDAFYARTFTGVPQAMVSAGTDINVPILPASPTSPIFPFDTIVYDTDQIVNIDDPENLFIPRRSGYYQVEAWAASVQVNNDATCFIGLNAGGDDNSFTQFDGSNTTATLASRYAQVNKLVKWTVGGLQFPISVFESSTPSRVSLVSAAIYWVGDL
jgi:hypothetical protein